MGESPMYKTANGSTEGKGGKKYNVTMREHVVPEGN